MPDLVWATGADGHPRWVKMGSASCRGAKAAAAAGQMHNFGNITFPIVLHKLIWL
jgi:hypothetical protein